jgi:hypothetical protein
MQANIIEERKISPLADRVVIRGGVVCLLQKYILWDEEPFVGIRIERESGNTFSAEIEMPGATALSVRGSPIEVVVSSLGTDAKRYARIFNLSGLTPENIEGNLTGFEVEFN